MTYSVFRRETGGRANRELLVLVAEGIAPKGANLSTDEAEADAIAQAAELEEVGGAGTYLAVPEPLNLKDVRLVKRARVAPHVEPTPEVRPTA